VWLNAWGQRRGKGGPSKVHDSTPHWNTASRKHPMLTMSQEPSRAKLKELILLERIIIVSHIHIHRPRIV
jgi:hypothetical protein